MENWSLGGTLITIDHLILLVLELQIEANLLNNIQSRAIECLFKCMLYKLVY